MVQMLSFIPLINGVMPANMEMFMKDYLSVVSITIPFSLFPSFIPNPLAWIAVFISDAFNDRFHQFGFESASFLWNFAEQLLTWLIMLVIYTTLSVISLYLPDNRL